MFSVQVYGQYERKTGWFQRPNTRLSPVTPARIGTADVLIAGSGIIGLSAAAAAANLGLRVLLIGEPSPGEASPAAAGLLAPSVEEVTAAHRFAIASRDRYPSYLEWVFEKTGIRVPLNRTGILEVALDDHETATLTTASRRGAQWLSAQELGAIEPPLAHAAGGFLHPDDGAVDNVELLRALKELVEREPGIEWRAERVSQLDPEAGRVTTPIGEYSAATIVIAAGAWSPRITGLPRPLPVEPVRGQMVAARADVVSRPVFGAGVYLVPRAHDRTVIGSTMERVGFDSRTTGSGLDELRRGAVRLCPSLAPTDMSEGWAGLRPVTPDLLPIIDRDPDFPGLIYACGHSRNGILMAPLTADCVAQLAAGRSPAHDLSPFAISRFARTVAV